MIITIDGPAAAGKSTIARQLAARLNIEYLDTGAMYRAVTWAALGKQVDLENETELARLACSLQYKVISDAIYVDDQDVTLELRTPQVTDAVVRIADHPTVRSELVQWQRNFVEGRSVVSEGRDQGTVVFPDAQVKIFLTASPEERARRRAEQMKSLGIDADYETILRNQQDRDARDAKREVGRLKPADDAVDVTTDGLSIEQVIEAIERIVQERVAHSG